MGARRRTGFSGGGHRLRVRLDGAGRHEGGGVRREQDLADQAAVPDTHTDAYAHADSYAHTDSDTPAAEADAESVSGPDATASEAEAHGQARAAASTASARTTPGGAPALADPQARATAAPSPGTETVGRTDPASVRLARALPAVSRRAAATADEQHDVAPHLRPARHGARGGRRRRAARALIPEALE
ncbi:hypothetical protein ACWIF2_20515, partial [Streptomyces sp. NPDC055506]